MTLSELVKDFPTTPFLFIGSGLTRRYYNLPNWETLLKTFAARMDPDPIFYAHYENMAKASPTPVGVLPKIASLLESDFNERWFSEPSFRKADAQYIDFVVNHSCSPFKVEIAQYLQACSKENPHYEQEVQKFKSLSKKSISGIITTNYDTFLETHTDEYQTYIGQETLVFSAIQGISEIYKIHGCVSLPDSMVLTEKDYLEFERKEAYLAAKLMTIFMEYPIVFLGYSISDANIRKILEAMIDCLSEENITKLQKRFVFVQYDPSVKEPIISTSPFVIQDKTLVFTIVCLSDFSLLYDALAQKKAAMPVKMFRLFKQEFYNYVLTNTPTANLRVRDLDDPDLENGECVLAIGKPSTLGVKGLYGYSPNEWYTDIILDNSDFTADDLLQYAFPALIKGVTGLPLNKFLYFAKEEHPECLPYIQNQTFEGLISQSFKKARHYIPKDKHSVISIWNTAEYNLEKRTRLIAQLKEEEIDINDLEKVLLSLFEENPRLLLDGKLEPACATNIRRLIRIYDFLKYYQKKEAIPMRS